MNATRSPLYQQLLTRLQQREAELRALLQADDARALTSATGEAEVTDFKELAAQGASSAVEDVQMAHAADELATVLAAQRRLDDGSYGFCAECGEPVAEQRLLAMPQALYCTACQALHEHSSRS
ncbi:MAG: TraR/DksA C4-type zinc finger protein [Hydrogenophaga sp.]|jgi:DnaK suppressor protein|uniref:TraR/DksA family transcriptional regulator n=1 Tax=Hydrogenophaga sp. TaxID=1904254 RepID=UPI00260322DE|nr:TraR/DksA C4-type zinc finger protein [Hydrogenophaga sp.]MCW5668287.1 TraR/DksA C4-type zinc finger protein [Hydrogenophaga sp.]